MIVDPDIFDGYCEMAVQSLEGVAFQADAAARFFQRGDLHAGIETYRRILALHREFAAPAVKAIEAARPDQMTTEAATEWRANRKPPRNKVGVPKEVRKPSAVYDDKASQVGAVELHRATKAGEARA